MGIILVVLLVVLLLGAVPRPATYSADWGYGPSGIVGLLLVVLLVLLLMGHVPWGGWW